MRPGKRRGLALTAVVLGMPTMLGGCVDGNRICYQISLCIADRSQGSYSRLYMRPESPVEGERVSFEVHRLPYPDPETVSYVLSAHPGQEGPRRDVAPGLLGGLWWSRGEGTTTHSFSEAGVHWVDAHARYSNGQSDSVFKRFIVRRASSSNLPPATARLTVSPNPAQVGQMVSFDASGSTASDGASITGYEWDLEGEGTYAPEDTGAYTSSLYYQSGTYNVGVRVTDSAGQSATQTVPLQVGASSPSPAVARQARSARGLPFSLRLGGRVTRVPEPTLSGRIVTTRGVGLSGRGRGGLGRPAAQRKGPNALVQRLMTGQWRMSLTSSTDKLTGTGKITGSALVVARGPRSAPRACVEVKAPVQRYRPQAASFTVVGGTGRAARLRASGRIAIPRIRKTEVSPLKGRVIVGSGAQRSLPKGCGTSRYSPKPR